MKILIVDDEVTIRRMMRLTLDTEHTVVEAADGSAALAAIRDRGPFDVVLLDQKMPGMTGMELLRHIAFTSPETRVVMITAFASLGLAAESFRSGARHFLCKPTTPDVLRAAIHSAAARPGLAPADPVAVRDGDTITLNGFTLVRTAEPVRVDRDGSAIHVFTVTHALGDWSRLVSVRFGPHAFHRAGRAGLAPGSRVAQCAAREALAEYLFQEGLLPAGDRLQVDEVDSAHLSAAQREAAET